MPYSQTWRWMSDVEWASSFLWPFKNPAQPEMGVLASWGFPHSQWLLSEIRLSLSFGYLHWKCWKLGIFLCGLFCTKMIHSYYLIQANIQNISPSHCGSCPSIFSSMKIFHAVFFIHAITFFPHITHYLCGLFRNRLSHHLFPWWWCLVN